MLSRVIDDTNQINGKEDGWANLRHYNKDKSRKSFFADEIVKLTETWHLKWIISKSKDVVVTTVDGWTIVITKHTQLGGRYIGGTISKYQLVVFKNEQEIISFEDGCDNADYNSNSHRLPIMDIYDVATTGKFRKIPPAHVCGASGFGQSSSDTCPACEGN